VTRHRPRLAFLIKTLQQALRLELDAALRPVGLTVPQMAVLAMLLRHPGASNAELARATFVAPQSMGETFQSLEKQSLVVRAADPHNARIRRAMLTPKGLRALKAANVEVEAVEARLVAALGPGDERVLRGLLERCIAAFAPPPPSARGPGPAAPRERA
jgi:DNA-binding MarR family transcriptional regulator